MKSSSLATLGRVGHLLWLRSYKIAVFSCSNDQHTLPCEALEWQHCRCFGPCWGMWHIRGACVCIFTVCSGLYRRPAQWLCFVLNISSPKKMDSFDKFSRSLPAFPHCCWWRQSTLPASVCASSHVAAGPTSSEPPAQLCSHAHKSLPALLLVWWGPESEPGPLQLVILSTWVIWTSKDKPWGLLF